MGLNGNHYVNIIYYIFHQYSFPIAMLFHSLHIIYIYRGRERVSTLVNEENMILNLDRITHLFRNLGMHRDNIRLELDNLPMEYQVKFKTI